jgi:hypothetical protein
LNCISFLKSQIVDGKESVGWDSNPDSRVPGKKPDLKEQINAGKESRPTF